jgi:hypothetical protein
MAPGSTQPLTEMSTRNVPGGKGRPAPEADSVTAIVEKIWDPRRLTALWAFRACYSLLQAYYKSEDKTLHKLIF